jgi:hypothetical protein
MANPTAIASSEIASSLKSKKFKTLTDHLNAAMKLAKNHWLIAEDNERFKAAIGAVMTTCSDEDRQRLKTEMKVIETMSLAIMGIGVDLSQAVPEGFKAIGLVKMWQEAA